MSEEIDEGNTMTCDSCRKIIPKEEARFMPLKMCCKVEQIPLCKDCWEKYAYKS